MKRFLTVVVIAGILVLALTATTFAAREHQGQSPQANPTVAPPSDAMPGVQSRQGQSGSPAYGMGRGGMGRGMGMRGAMHMGGGGMMGSMQMGTGPGATQGQMGLGAGGVYSMTNAVMMAGAVPMHDDLEELLGISDQELYSHMAAGKTLVQIATERGMTEQQLIAGILAGRRMAFDEAVMNGYMTQVQADAMLANMESHVRTMVNTQGMGFGPGGAGMMWR